MSELSLYEEAFALNGTSNAYIHLFNFQRLADFSLEMFIMLILHLNTSLCAMCQPIFTNEYKTK